MTDTKTYLVRMGNTMAMWYGGQIIAAWDHTSGYKASLFMAYVMTRDIAGSSTAPTAPASSKEKTE